MSIYYLQFSLFIASATIPLAAGAYRFRDCDVSIRILLLLIGLSAITEAWSFYLVSNGRQNIWLYNYYNVVEVLCYGLYFNYSIISLRKWRGGWWIGIAGIIWALSSTWLFPRDKGESAFLITEGAIIIALCMYGFFKMMIGEEDIHPARNIHFWIILSIISY